MVPPVDGDGSLPEPPDPDGGPPEPPPEEGDGGPIDPPDPDGGTRDGLITPSRPQSELVASTVTYYETWKGRYLVAGCNAGEMRVRSAPDTDDFTVSEAHGYGMLFTVLMAAHDDAAQTTFDGLARYFANHQSDITDGLMAWAQDEGCDDVSGDNAATDGDLDIAYAFLLADATWGSGGTVNYLEEGKRVARAILEGEVADQNYLLIGDWVDDGQLSEGTRASDFMPEHFRAFAEASGDDRWDSVLDKTYGIVANIQERHSTSGLLPDFIVDAATDDEKPTDGKWLEGGHDGDYHYNACRVPWRLASDFLVSGEARSRAAVRELNAFIRERTKNDPYAIVDGYTLSGEPYGRYPSLAFVAPFAVAAMVEPEQGTNQEWLDQLWDFVVTEDDDGYYSDSIKLGAMIAISGLYRMP